MDGDKQPGAGSSLNYVGVMVGAALGVGLGIVFGLVVLDNPALGIGPGIAFGIALGIAYDLYRRDKHGA